MSSKKKLSGGAIYTSENCIGLRDNDKLQGKILVLSTDFFFDEYKHPEYQLVYCEYAYSYKICCRFLWDKEFAVYERADFLGRLNPSELPEWAMKKYLAIINKQITEKRKLTRTRDMLKQRLAAAVKRTRA